MENYKLKKQLCMFSNEIWYVALYKAISLENGFDIFVLIYHDGINPTERRTYTRLGTAFENFLKKVYI